MDNHPTSPPLRDPFAERPSVRDLYELLRLPALFAVGTAVITWLIWYYTSISCTAELAAQIGCNPATIARYINVDVYGRMLTYSALAAGVGGVWNYDMFTKMRAVIVAERSRADEAEKQLAEYRQQAEEERRLRDEERRQEREAFMTAFAEERRRSDEERQQMQQQANEDRQQMQQRANEDRQQMQQEANEERRRSDEERRLLQQQASENQQAFVAVLTEITAQMAHLAQQRNGSNGDAPNGD